MKKFRPEASTLEERSMLSTTAVALPKLPAIDLAKIAAEALGSRTPHITAAAHQLTRHEAATQLRAILNAATAQAGAPGMAGAVVLNGKLVAQEAVGVRERGRPAKVHVGDQFNLGSVSKSMTATLAGVLVGRGKIRWDTTIGQAFPELKGKINPAYANVTLRQLLDHRGGLPADSGLDPRIVDLAVNFRGSGPEARRTFLRAILNTPPADAVGQFTYSNSGYIVAAAMMERAAGTGYEILMHRYVFAPLAMSSAGFGVPGRGHPLSEPVQPSGHDASGAPVGYGRSPVAAPIVDPAGGIYMNMRDWTKFLRMQMNENVNGLRLLNAPTLQLLHTADPRPIPAYGGALYGAGWVTIQTPVGPALWHNGSNGDWYSEQVLFPAQRAAIVLAANQGGPAVESAVDQALSAAVLRFVA